MMGYPSYQRYLVGSSPLMWLFIRRSYFLLCGHAIKRMDLVGVSLTANCKYKICQKYCSPKLGYQTKSVTSRYSSTLAEVCTRIF